MSSNFKELRLAAVSRHFDNPSGARIAALHELTLTIRRGEFICLLGPSGCGKTTALNCIAGLLPVTGGTISLDEQRIDLLPPEKRGFGMVFQNYALFPHMTVAKNVAFGLTMRGTPRDEMAARVARAFRLVQLTGHEDKLPGQLSGGQQQRVAIARSLAMNPRVMLFDEVTSALDPELTKEVLRVMEALSQGGMTMMLVTHEMAFARRAASRVIFMHGGKIREEGPPATLFERPRTPELAQFLEAVL